MNEVIPFKPVTEWAAQINAEWRKSVEGIINTGRLISQALEEIQHGEKEAFYSLLPFSEQTAKKLRQIGEDKRISDRAHVRDLPPSWGTLYELSRLARIAHSRRIWRFRGDV